MPLTYIIESTDSTLSFRLNPGEKDGYSGTQRNSDLTLQGYGVLSWGEDVNENLLRTLENHACPAKELNDFNPTSGLYDYDPAVDPLLPKQEGDQQTGSQNFGPGKGINTPIYGQLWFNKDDNRMYQYTQNDEWTTVSGVPTTEPSNPINGDLWYDEAIPQLKIWNGLAWESTAERYVLKAGDVMTGFLQLNADPVDPLHAATKNYVDFEINDKAVQRLGDTMTGILTLFADPTNPLDAATMNYVDTEIAGAGHVLKVGDTMTGDLLMVGTADVRIFPDATGYGGVGIFPETGGGAALQLMTSDVFNGAVSTAPPMIEFWNNQNSAVVGGASGTWGWTRWCPRDGSIMRLEADLDPLTLGPNTEAILDVGQDGLMQYWGIPGGGNNNVIRLPNTTTANVGANVKNLTTVEYAIELINYINSVTPSGPTFISPQTITTGNTNGNWVTINAQSYGVPNGATTIIFDYYGTIGEGPSPELKLRDHGNTSHETRIGAWRMYVSGGHDGSYRQSGIGMMNCNTSEQFDYNIGGGISVTLRITGYFI